MAQETSKRDYEKEMLEDITRIFNELISSARGASKPIQSIPVKFVSNNSWRAWDITARLGEHSSTYRIPQRTCGYVTVSAAIHKFNESRGDIYISDLKASHEGECWMFNIETSNDPTRQSA